MDKYERNALHAKEMELIRAAEARRRQEHKEQFWREFNEKRVEAIGQMALFDIEIPPNREQMPETD